MITTIKQANAIAGTLGNPSKMPGKSYGLPAASAEWVPAACIADDIPIPFRYGCPIGAKLARIKGTTCYSCYATKGKYNYSDVHLGQARRVSGLYHDDWVDAMVLLITRQCKEPYFRWHDSGDLLGVWHLRKIIEVCERTPHIRHWLPTREAAFIMACADSIPENLVIRISATKVDSKPGSYLYLDKTITFFNTSTVHDKAPAIGHTCPAPTQGNNCGKCRACWSSEIQNVSYHIH